MKLPISLRDKKEWSLLGPLGPELPSQLASFPILGIDGGAAFSSHLDLWIGDGDSLLKEPSQDESYPVIHLSRNKDSSDLSCALALFQESRVTLHLWGFLGGRRDHELFVLGECLHYLSESKGSKIYLYGNGAQRFALYSAGNWELGHQGLFSLGALHRPELELTGRVQYPISPARELPPLSSFGLSNEAHGDFQVKASNSFFIYFPEHK